MSRSLWEQNTSARGTPRLEGHLTARDKIKKLILDFSESYLIYIYGSGGIGKTRLVQDILEYPPKSPDLVVATQLIDLYHTRNHSLTGLINAFLEVIPGFKDSFRQQLAANEKWNKMARLEQEGLPLAEIISLRRDLTEFFLKALSEFKGKRRLVIALDTAERLLLADQPIQQQLGIEDHIMPILDWILNEFLPRVENSVVLLAGRPGVGKLLERLQQIDEKRLELIELVGLSEQEAFKYFDAVAEAAEKEGDHDTARWIRLIDSDQRKAIYENLCEYDSAGNKVGVRPIQLSLVIDNYVVSGTLQNEILTPSTEQPASEERRKRFDRILVRDFQDFSRPINEVLRLMALMPKGLDVGFLKNLLEVEDAEQRLLDVYPLSFVKKRPSDARIFLHDEIYALLNENIWKKEASLPLATKLRKVILAEYKERIDKAKERLAELNKGMLALESEANVEHGSRKAAPSEIIEARADLQNLLVEHVHYELEQDPEKGFATYYHYAEEAVLSNDESLDIQLRAELLTFLQHSGQKKLLGLKASADADAAVRWVKRFVSEGNHAKAIELAQELRSRHRTLLNGGGGLAAIELTIWEALALTRQNMGMERAAKILDTAIKKLNGLPHSVRRDCILARAYNNLGYLLRSQGKYFGADQVYKKALPLWRGIRMEVEQANTLNNHAFVHSEIGNFESAWAQAWDGLKLRERHGRLSSVILSLNTLAHVRTQENALDDSLHYIGRALALTEQLQNPRERGLALIESAEANRRISEWDKYALQTEAYLKVAIENGEAARKIFSESVKEPERLVRALIELGCAYRDWAQFMRDRNGLDYPETQKRAAEAEKAFAEAAEKAEKEGLLHLRVDALVNQAWLYYYMHKEQVEETLRRIYHEKKGISAVYKAGKQAPGKLFKLKKEDAVIPFLTLLGKAHLVRGQMKFAIFERSRDEKMLSSAVENYTLSLAYFSIYGDYGPREMRRAQERIHRRIKTLSIEQLKKVKTFVKSTEKKYNLRARSRMWQLLDERGLIIGD